MSYQPQKQQEALLPNTVVVNVGEGEGVKSAPYDSEHCCSNTTLACFTFWACSMLLGLGAYVLAVVAQDHDLSSRRTSAERIGKKSRCLSYVGIGIGVVCTIIFVVFFVMGFHWLDLLIARAQGGSSSGRDYPPRDWRINQHTKNTLNINVNTINIALCHCRHTRWQCNLVLFSCPNLMLTLIINVNSVTLINRVH